MTGNLGDSNGLEVEPGPTAEDAVVPETVARLHSRPTEDLMDQGKPEHLSKAGGSSKEETLTDLGRAEDALGRQPSFLEESAAFPPSEQPNPEKRNGIHSSAEDGLRRRRPATDDASGDLLSERVEARDLPKGESSIVGTFHHIGKIASKAYHENPVLVLGILAAALLVFLAISFAMGSNEEPQPPPLPTFQSHFSLLRPNPFDKLSAELLEREVSRLASGDRTMDRSNVPSPVDYYHIPSDWQSVLSDSPNVALIFGERGSGKSTLRILAEKHILKLYNLRSSNETRALSRTITGSGVLLIDITPEQQSLNAFFPVLKHNMYKQRPWKKVWYTDETDYWVLEFHNEFKIKDFVDMILGRGVTLLVDALVAQAAPQRANATSFLSRVLDFSLGKWLVVPPLGLSTASAYELGRFAGTYYMGNTDSLQSILTMAERDVEFWWGYKKFWSFLRRLLWGGSSSSGSGVFGSFSEGSLIAFTGIILGVYRVNLIFFDILSLRRRLGIVSEAWGLAAFMWVIWTLWWIWRSKWDWLWRFVTNFSGMISYLGSALRGGFELLKSGKRKASGDSNRSPSSSGENWADNQDDNYRPRVIPTFDGRETLLEPFVKECRMRNIRWESSVSRLKSFRKLVSELGYGAMVVLLDGIEETPLSNPLENEGVVPHFVKTVLQHSLFEISMDKQEGMETS